MSKHVRSVIGTRGSLMIDADAAEILPASITVDAAERDARYAGNTPMFRMSTAITVTNDLATIMVGVVIKDQDVIRKDRKQKV